MTDERSNVASWLAGGAGVAYAFLTTIGRRTGEPHRIEIWFAVLDGRVYLMSGGRDRADWVRNLMASPEVTVEIGGEAWTGVARVIAAGTPENDLARDLLVDTYATAGNPLVDWKRRSLPVVIEFPHVDASGTVNEGAAR